MLNLITKKLQQVLNNNDQIHYNFPSLAKQKTTHYQKNRKQPK